METSTCGCTRDKQPRPSPTNLQAPAPPPAFCGLHPLPSDASLFPSRQLTMCTKAARSLSFLEGPAPHVSVSIRDILQTLKQQLACLSTYIVFPIVGIASVIVPSLCHPSFLVYNPLSTTTHSRKMAANGVKKLDDPTEYQKIFQ